MEEVNAESTASAERLWEVVSDVGSWPERLPTFTSVRHVCGPKPTRVGSRFQVRQPWLAPAFYEVTEWIPGRAFTWAARSLGVTTTATHTISPTPAGARIDLGIEWTGPLAGVARVLLSGRTRRMMRVEAAAFVRLAEHG